MTCRLLNGDEYWWIYYPYIWSDFAAQKASDTKWTVYVSIFPRNINIYICIFYHSLTLRRRKLLKFSLRWRRNGRDGVSNHQPHECLLNRLFRRRSKKTSKLRVTGLCAGNSPGTGEFPAQMASNAENVPFDDVIMFFVVDEDSFIMRSQYNGYWRHGDIQSHGISNNFNDLFQKKKKQYSSLSARWVKLSHRHMPEQPIDLLANSAIT